MIKTIFLALLLLLTFSGCGKKEEIIPSGKTIKIGVLAPLSGKDKRLGNQSVIGLKAAKMMHKYLENGDEIIFEIIDTKSEPESSKIALSNLVSKDVVVIFSFMASSELLLLKSELQKYQIPIISTLATDNNISSTNSSIAQVCIDNNTQVLVASHYLRDDKLIDNIGIIYNKKNYYSGVLADEFSYYFSSIGGEIEFFLDLSNPSDLKKFQNIKTEDIKMLFNTTDAIITTEVLKIIQNKKFKYKLLGTDGLLSDALELDKKSLKLFDGVYVVEHYAHNVDKTKNRKKLEELLEKDGLKESSYSFLAYDGYQLLIDALEICNDYDAKCIHAIIQNSNVIEGVSGNFTMMNSKVKRKVYIDKIQNSKLKKEVVVY